MPLDVEDMTFPELVAAAAVLHDQIALAVDGYYAWSVGTPTGGPMGDGRYPMPVAGGGTVLVPCPAAVAAMIKAPLSVGLLSDLASLKVPPEIDVIRTAGHGAIGAGGATYKATATTGATAYRKQSSDGQWFELAELAPDGKMVGATGGGSTDDAAALAALIDRLPAAGGGAKLLDGDYRSTSTWSLSKPVDLAALGARLRVENATGARINSAGVRINGLRFIGATGVQEALAAAAGSNSARLRDVSIDTSASLAAGHGLQLNATGLNDWRVSSLDINAKAYGLLVNSGAGGLDGLVVSDFSITAGSDAIEINTPDTASKNLVIWGGLLKSTKTSGVGAGFGLGVAHCQGFVAGGFVSRGSWLEGLHVEDRSSHGVFSSFALLDTGPKGLVHLRSNTVPTTEPSPLVFSGFVIRGKAGTPATDSAGFYSVWDFSGQNSRSPILGGFIDNYQNGVWLDGEGLYAISHISARNVTNVLRLGPKGRAPGGVMFSENADTLLFVEASGGASAGSFHQESVAPNHVIRTNTPTVPGSTVEGFSFPAATTATGLPAGTTWIDLFPAPKMMFGRLRIWVSGNFGLGSFFEGTVKFDGIEGTTEDPDAPIVTTDIISHAYGDMALTYDAVDGCFRIVDGVVQGRWYSLAGLTPLRWRIEFKGTYYA